MRPTYGMVIGKFCPLHLGHEYLIRFAATYVDHLHVVVCTTPHETIDGKLRFGWVNEMFSGLKTVTVTHLDEDLPPSPEEFDGPPEEFWRIWKTVLRQVQFRFVGPEVTHVFTSEDYGWRLAEELGAKHVPVNTKRNVIPISGTMLRQDVIKNWEYLCEAARPEFVYRIVIGGSESSGKSTLARKLAEAFDTISVPEYGRDFYEMRLKPGEPYKCLPEHIPEIYRCHRASTEALARIANRVLFIDTDPIITHLFSEFYFGGTSREVLEGMHTYKADLTLVCAPNVPHVDDGMRDLPHVREKFFEKYCAILTDLKRPFKVIDSTLWSTREATAYNHVMNLIGYSTWNR